MRSSINGLVPEPERVAELSDREQGRFWHARPRSVELRRQGLKSMPNGVPMSWFVSVYHQDPLHLLRRRGPHRGRRWPPLPGCQRGRHEHLLWLRPARGDRGDRRAGEARGAVHAAC